MSYNHLQLSYILCCDGPKTYHKINLITMSVNRVPGSWIAVACVIVSLCVAINSLRAE